MSKAVLLMNKVPSSKELIIPTMEALEVLGGSGTIQEITNTVIDLLQIPTEVAEVLHDEKSNQTRLKYNLAWARTYLKRYGMLNNPRRGVWAVVPGQQDGEIDPDHIVKTPPIDSGQDDPIPPENGESWRGNLLRILTQTLSPDGFERLVQRLLREYGFTEVQITGKPGDGGIDGTGIAKINDLMSFPVIFQCKRYKTSTAVTASNIRDFRGTMAGRTDKGLFFTTSTFTRDAQKEATRDGVPLIDLIDGEQLMDKLKELRIGIKVETVEDVTIDEAWYSKL